MFTALGACWVPPPKDQARHGTRRTYSTEEAQAAVRDVYHDAVDAALERCAPLHFSKAMAGAVAGRPITIRFIDNRTINNGEGQH
jgi:hypothetical protein